MLDFVVWGNENIKNKSKGSALSIYFETYHRWFSSTAGLENEELTGKQAKELSVLTRWPLQLILHALLSRADQHLTGSASQKTEQLLMFLWFGLWENRE